MYPNPTPALSVEDVGSLQMAKSTAVTGSAMRSWVFPKIVGFSLINSPSILGVFPVFLETPIYNIGVTNLANQPTDYPSTTHLFQMFLSGLTGCCQQQHRLTGTVSFLFENRLLGAKVGQLSGLAREP